MFVFSSICSTGVWFVVRLLYDLARPGDRAARPRIRFWAITLIAATLVTASFSAMFTALFSAYAGTFAAVVVAPAYIGLTVVLHRLVAAFGDDAWDEQPPRGPAPS